MKQQSEFDKLMDKNFKGRIYESTKKNGFTCNLEEIKNLELFCKQAKKDGWQTKPTDYMGRKYLILKHVGY